MSQPRSEMEVMELSQRLRRVVLLCASFTRNLAYYRALFPVDKRGTSRDFWQTVSNNHIDTAVLEWCKLFGDDRAHQGWKNIISGTDVVQFHEGLLAHLGMTADEYNVFIEKVRWYRDKFVAHLDSEMTMEIPVLETARLAVEYLHRYIVENEASPGDLHDLPVSMPEYYKNEHRTASEVAQTAIRAIGPE